MTEYPKIHTIFKRTPDGKRLLSEFSLPEFEYLQNCLWDWTEKVDGTNIRVMWDGKEVRFGGKTNNAQIPVFLYNKLSELFQGSEKLVLWKELFPEGGVCLYGEGYGARIQKGGGNYKSDGVDFVLFDILIDRWWLERNNIEDVASKFNISIVPIIDVGTLEQMVDCVKRGFISNWGNFNAEGIVARPKVDLYNRRGWRIITKLKHKDFKGL